MELIATMGDPNLMLQHWGIGQWIKVCDTVPPVNEHLDFHVDMKKYLGLVGRINAASQVYGIDNWVTLRFPGVEQESIWTWLTEWLTISTDIRTDSAAEKHNHTTQHSTKQYWGCPHCGSATDIEEQGTLLAGFQGSFGADGNWEGGDTNELDYSTYEFTAYYCVQCGEDFHNPKQWPVHDLS